MAKNCGCPVGFNIFIGVFLVAFSLISWLKLFAIDLPVWLSVTILILGLLSIILNTLNRSYISAEDLTPEQANKMHANEGF